MDLWKPSVTVAAVVVRDGRYLMVEEHTREGVRLNQPAGHLDPGESLEQACVREALEETAHRVRPRACVGVYLGRYRHPGDGTDVTYLRFAFDCEPLAFEPARALDEGIVRALWMPPDEIRARVAEHRSPLVLETLDDHLAGRRFDLAFLRTHPDCLDDRA
jgi:8-oxo-dGTP pyrophosphatase MutT (NUDIX family)